MNYYYFLLVITFLILAKQSQMLLKIKESYLSTKSIYQLYLFSTFIGYILIAISVFKNFQWFYAILIIIGGFTILPFVASILMPIRINKLLESDARLLYLPILLSITASILLLINLM